MGYYLYLFFVCSTFLHLTSRIPLFGRIRLDMLIAGVVLISAVISKMENMHKIVDISKNSKALYFLIGYILVSIPFVEWPGSVIRFGLYNYTKTIMFYFFTVWCVDSEKKFKTFIYLFILCQAIRIIEPLFLHVTYGYWGSSTHIEGGRFMNRLSSGPHDVYNPNQFAWLIVTTLAFFYYCIWLNNKRFKIMFLCFLPMSIYALVLTASRSGLISLGALIIAIIILGKDRLRKLMVFGALLIPLTIIVGGYLDSDLSDRYRSIWDSSSPGRGSAESRIRGIKSFFFTTLHRPIFGHGLGSSAETNVNIYGTKKAQPSHNLYIETIQELGLVGFFFFCLYVKAIINSLIRSRKILISLATNSSLLEKSVNATLAWIMMHLLYSLSCFGLSSWEWYFFGGVSTVCLRLAKESAENESDYNEKQSVLSSHAA